MIIECQKCDLLFVNYFGSFGLCSLCETGVYEYEHCQSCDVELDLENVNECRHCKDSLVCPNCSLCTVCRNKLPLPTGKNQRKANQIKKACERALLVQEKKNNSKRLGKP